MEKNKNQYGKIIDILKKSKPVLYNSEAVEEKVMERIKNKRRSSTDSDILDYLFGWVYIGWVRKGLVLASLFLIGVFVFQQSLILKRINLLERQTITTGNMFAESTSNNVEATLMLFKRSGTILPLRDTNKVLKQLKRVIESANKLQDQYDDLLKLIENDPELKQYIEKRLSESDKRKFNL